jgi:outer membrane protein assembly factor BamA
MPVKTRVTYEDGTEDSFTSDGIKDEELLPLASDKKLARASADPDRLMLDADRVNNHYPRLLDKKLVPLYHGLYDVPLFTNDSAYTWLTGPSFSADGIGARTSLQRPGDWITYAATHYDTNIDALNSSAGFQIHNIAGRYMSAGVEFFDRQVWGDEEDDLQSYKVFLRQELGLPYSFLEPASHATLYMLHNRSAGRSGYLGSKEEAIGRRYKQKKETIVGATYYSSNAGPLPDPAMGYKFSGMGEIGGHMLGGADSFLRTSLEYDRYMELVAGHKLAWRLKYGGGYPDDKYLFYLGSDKELRGYDYKEVQGSSCLLGSLEYRFPMARDIDLRVPYNLAVFDEVQGVLFFDAGSAWYDDFNEPGVYKDIGFGLRFYFNVAGSVERIALRLDIAYPLDGDDRDIHTWVSVNHAF